MRNLLCHKVIQKYGLVYKIPMIIIYSKNIRISIDKEIKMVYYTHTINHTSAI